MGVAAVAATGAPLPAPQGVAMEMLLGGGGVGVTKGVMETPLQLLGVWGATWTTPLSSSRRRGSRVVGGMVVVVAEGVVGEVGMVVVAGGRPLGVLLGCLPLVTGPVAAA